MQDSKALEFVNQSLWDDFVSLFPPQTAKIAENLGVMKGARQDKDLFNAMRVLLMHLSSDLSLKETAVRGKIAGICSMSAVALHFRLIKFGPFFKELCRVLLEQSYQSSIGDKLKIIDATDIREPGPTGSTYRLHTEFSLPSLCIDAMKLTTMHGKGNGESFCHFEVKKGDILFGDRAYSRIGGISYVVENEGQVIVRYNYGTLPVFQPDGKRFNLAGALETLKEEGDSASWSCEIKDSESGKVIKGRLCAVRKTEEDIQKAHRKSTRASKKNGYTVRELTLLVNEYIIVFTTLPEKEFPLSKVLELYRWRWQVELVFKRLKSLLQLGCLPKTTGESAFAWLYGKMFLALLIEKISIRGCAFSPWRKCAAEDQIQRILMENI